MRRSFVCLFLILALLTSIASADSLFRSDRFEFNLPDQWHCLTAEGNYIRCAREEKSSNVESFTVNEYSTDQWPDSPEQIVDIIREESGQASAEEWEELEIDGQKTVVVYFSIPLDGLICLSAVNAGDHHALIRYISVRGHGNMDNFLNIMKTFCVRDTCKSAAEGKK